MNWYIIDKDYVNYLCGYDSKVGYVEYGDKLKLHIGIIIEINNFKYYVPVSSPKEKHKKMRNGIDFQKIIDNENNIFYAVININNMIPVPDKYVTKLKYNEIQNYRKFANDAEKDNYIYLLQQELYIINKLAQTLTNNAKKLYDKVLTNTSSSLSKRCCDFTLLEKKALEYVK